MKILKIILLVLVVASSVYSQGIFRRIKATEDSLLSTKADLSFVKNLAQKGKDSLEAHTNRMNELESNINTITQNAVNYLLITALNDSNYVKTTETVNWDKTLDTWKTGIATKNINDASGTQNIAHGLGRTPVFVKVTAICVYTAAVSMIVSGTYDGTNHAGLCMIYTEGTSTATIDNIYNSTSAELGFATTGATNPYSGANRQTGVITVTSTNIVITWTKAGTVNSNTVFIQWEVY